MATAPRQEGFPWLMPYLAVKDVDRSKAFYQQAFGFEEDNALHTPDGKLAHAALTYHDQRILIGVEDAGHTAESPIGRTPNTLGGAGLVLYLFHADVDALFKRAIEAGATEGFPPEDMFWGDRVCLLFDPDGHAWNFATHKFDYP